MPDKKDVHVTFDRERDQWKVKSEGADRAAGFYDKKTDAEETGRRIAQNNQSDYIGHRKDGVINDHDSYGKDPNPPKDTER